MLQTLEQPKKLNRELPQWRTAPTPPVPRSSYCDTESTAESELINRLAANDEAAFEQLVREYGPRMTCIARRYLRCHFDVEDAVQQSYLAIIRSLHRFQRGCCFATWLHRIVVNTCLMQIRGRRRRPAQSIDGKLPDQDRRRANDVGFSDCSASTQEGLEREETFHQIRDCLRDLSDHHRLVIQLRDVEGLDTLTTGLVLGVAEGAVKTRLHRARRALRRLYVGRFVD